MKYGPTLAFQFARTNICYILRSYVIRSSLTSMTGNRKLTPTRLRRTGNPPLLILTSLASGPKHGHGLAKDIESFAGVKLGPGTLYGAITRLEERGFIQPLDSQDRRRPYRITETGAKALAGAIAEMQQLSQVGALRLGFPVGLTS